MQEPTPFADIDFPSETIELENLKARDGSPVRVLVRPASQLELAAVVGRNPGLMPGSMEEWNELADAEKVGRMHGLAQLILPLSCTPVVDVRYLSAKDETELVTVALRLSGWAGGPAERVAFPPGERGRLVSGGRTDAPVREDGDPAPPTLRLVAAAARR